ncbi:hypothetical protein [Metabacillus fastidiosus]|uniref:hypothetical protein n=1 Tax=Metabacillus fastidiosus TaxID=1458 RepID=UPI0008254568|nr:hypothetical protein [Metabacillus fastidiosus]MED4464746.1 hypothetical protein [Metabacillus fastidiosus]
MTTIVNQELYSFEELKSILGVSAQQLFNIVANPAISKMTIANRLYFDRSTVRALSMREDY